MQQDKVEYFKIRAKLLEYDAGMSVVREHASNPSNIQMAMNAASSISDTLNEDSKKDS